MPLITTPVGVVHIEESGSGEPLLLLHANPGDPQDFDAVLPLLEEKYRVIRVSWPGYGQGPAPQPPSSATAMQFAELLVQLVRTLDLVHVRVIGNSVGGYAAAWLALVMPERIEALVLVSPGGFTEHSGFSRWFCHFKGRENVTRWLNPWLPYLYLRVKTPVVQAMRARAAGEQNVPVPVAVNAALWRSFIDPAHDLREAAMAIRARTLVVSGRHDPLIPPRDGANAARAIHGAQHVVMPCGHAPFAELPELFLAVVQPFLARREKTLP
ncbi:MAG: alpha/beta hydrolase [Moraxellaceae bacterium]|nr:alpha/beta hydrolase [Moraxellaceae bacterium]